MNVVLIGFKKSGKTTIGRILSSLFKKKFYDVDEVIKNLFADKYKNRKMKGIFEIFKFLKEEEFRKLENQAFFSLKDIDNSIISTSGGCILNKNNLMVLKRPKMIVYLKTSKNSLKKRIGRQKRSIFNEINIFEEEYEKRKNIYEKEADMMFLTDNKDFEKLSLKIKEKINV